MAVRAPHEWPVDDAPPSRGALRDWTLRRCYDLIFRGDLAPGDELDVSEMTSRLGVSRSPLREALARLEEDGLVVTSPANGRRYVAKIGREDIAELYEIRISLEGPACESAASRLSIETIERLTGLLEVMRFPARAPGGFGRDFEADLMFHEEIVRATGNRRLHRTLAPLWLETRAMLTRFDAEGVFPVADDIEKVIDEHAAVLMALRTGDGVAAREAMVYHIQEAQRTSVSLFDRLTGPVKR
jgi:DNA-binding GntR family transcriptional regulator